MLTRADKITAAMCSVLCIWSYRAFVQASRRLEKANREVEEAERELQEIEEKHAAKEAERNMRQLALFKEMEEEGPSENNRQAWEETFNGEQTMWRLLLNLRRAYRKGGETTDDKFLAFVDEQGVRPMWDDIAERNFPEFGLDDKGEWVRLPKIENVY